MKYYHVIFVDEYNNWYELGMYASLKDAEPDVNSQLEGYNYVDEDGNSTDEHPAFGVDKNLGPLQEYAGTFCPCFDRVIDVEEGCVQVRGFISSTELTIQELKELEEKHG